MTVYLLISNFCFQSTNSFRCFYPQHLFIPSKFHHILVTSWLWISSCLPPSLPPHLVHSISKYVMLNTLFGMQVWVNTSFCWHNVHWETSWRGVGCLNVACINLLKLGIKPPLLGLHDFGPLNEASSTIKMIKSLFYLLHMNSVLCIFLKIILTFW